MQVPAELAGVAEAVFGLDNLQQARPLHVRADAVPATSTAQNATALTPPEVAKLYDFPTNVTGKNQCIGLIEFGGGYTESDIDVAGPIAPDGDGGVATRPPC